MPGPRSETVKKQRLTERAAKGGNALKEKYGLEHFARIGKLGGRPTFWESLEKARAREIGVRANGVKPGRPRNAHPQGETKELPAETAAYRVRLVLAEEENQMVTAPPRPETPKPDTPKPEPSIRLTPEIMDWLVAFTDANPGITAQAMAGGQMITAVRQGPGIYLRCYRLES